MFSLVWLWLAGAVMMFVDAQGQQHASAANSSSRVEREANFRYYSYGNGLRGGSGYTGTRYATPRPITRLSARTLLGLLSVSNASLKQRHPGVSCVPTSHCVTPYGTKPEHFNLYGYVAPADYSCYSMNGLVLCVDKDHGATPTTSTTTTTTTTTTPHPPPPTQQPPTVIHLPCVPVDHCRVRFNHGYYHTAIYGHQKQCPHHQHVPCVAWHPTPTPTSTPTVWHPSPTPTSTPTVWHPSPTPTSTPTVWHPNPNPTMHPTPSPTMAPTPSNVVTGAPSHSSLPYNSVQIIGPRPIYVTLSKISGPQVLNLYNRHATGQERWATT